MRRVCVARGGAYRFVELGFRVLQQFDSVAVGFEAFGLPRAVGRGDARAALPNLGRVGPQLQRKGDGAEDARREGELCHFLGGEALFFGGGG